MLKGSGTMNVPDEYLTSRSNVNIDDFLPSPPLKGLPQRAIDDQWYYWWCPMDKKWIEFTGPNSIEVELFYHEPSDTFCVKTSAYGKSTVQKYRMYYP